MFYRYRVALLWFLLYVLAQVHCKKRKSVPTENELKFDKKLKRFHSRGSEKQNNIQLKQVQRTKSLPKQDLPGIFYDAKIEKQKKRMDEKLKSAEYRFSQSERMIHSRNNYAPLSAKNRSQIVKHHERSERREGTAETFKFAAQSLLYRSKQLENLNKDRLKSGKETFKNIPAKISRLQNLSALFMEGSKANQIASDESMENFHREMDRVDKFSHPKHIDINEEKDYKDNKKAYKKFGQTFSASGEFMDKHKEYFDLPKTRGELIKERAKSVA